MLYNKSLQIFYWYKALIPKLKQCNLYISFSLILIGIDFNSMIQELKILFMKIFICNRIFFSSVDIYWKGRHFLQNKVTESLQATRL